jgi:hypothetical protein
LREVLLTFRVRRSPSAGGLLSANDITYVGAIRMPRSDTDVQRPEILLPTCWGDIYHGKGHAAKWRARPTDAQVVVFRSEMNLSAQ